MNHLKRSLSKLSLVLVLACLVASSASAQSNRKLIRSGNKLFDKENYRAAIPFYEQVIAKDPNNAQAYYYAGISYMTFDKEKAADYIYKAQTLKPNVDRDLSYWLGRIDHINYRFDSAIENFQNYRKNDIRSRDEFRREEVAMLIQHARNAKREVENPKDVFVRNLGGTVNTEYSEHSPVISSNDNYLLFTSRGDIESGRLAQDGEYYEEIYESTRDENLEWSKPTSVAASLRSSGHDASIQLFDNDTKMLLYRGDKVNNGDIMYSERDASGQWGSPQSIGANINTRDFESDAFITKNGQTLFYSTSHFSENGDLDIYVSQRQNNGQWGKPRSIGNAINTKYDDDSPYLADDGVTLYFSSRGHNTMGGYDIFMAKYDSVARRWGKPVNMGAPINTPDDDTYYRLSPDGSYAYLSSYRIGGYGEKDIYTINYIKTARVIGRVYTQDSVAVPGIELVFNGLQADKRPISYRDVTKPEQGDFEVRVLSGRNYQVQISQDGKPLATQEIEIPVSLSDTTTIERDFYVTFVGEVPTITGTTPGRTAPTGTAETSFQNIYFDTDVYQLRPESMRELDAVVEYMKANPTVNVRIEGHTDSRASDSYNITLGDNRANAAYDYLVKQGISPKRLVTESYGERRPAVPNTGAENMQLNRRTEFRVIPRQQENMNQ